MKKIIATIIAVAFATCAFGVSAAPSLSETSLTSAGSFQVDTKAKKKAGKKKTAKKKAAATK